MGKARLLSVQAIKSLTRLGQESDQGLGPARKLLRQWLLDNQVTVAQFAMMCCMNRRSLDNALRGEFRSKGGYLQLHQAFAIEWATKGAVPAWLWLDDPAVKARIRDANFTNIKDFEDRIKAHVLKFNSLKTADGMLREKARVLSRLFNVQWGEVKRRAWLDAEKKAMLERADISHLLAPEDKGPTDDGIYYHGPDQDYHLDHQAWFDKWFTRL